MTEMPVTPDASEFARYSDPDWTAERTAAREEVLRTVLAQATDADMRAPSALPGWTRGHVAAHIEGVARSRARQARAAAEGRLVDVYDGGDAGRDAAIEADAGRSADAHRAAVDAALTDLADAWPVSTLGWTRPARCGGTVLGALHSWWRELVLHTDDLALPGAPRDWEPEFFVHVTEFLTPRVPDGVLLTLDPTDGPPVRALGSGSPVTLTAPLPDLTAWFAGRTPATPLTSDTGTVPELLPWP